MHARAATRHLVTIFLGATLGLAACSGDRYIVVGSARAPSTSGWVVIADATSHSADVTVHLEHLPRAKQLDPGLRIYVVWFEPTQGGAPNRAGTMKYYP